MFDVGVAGYLTKRNIAEQKGVEFGKAFEHFILMEIIAYRSYKGKDFPINFWRTKSGLEVDFILGQGEAAIEIKGSGHVDRRDMYALEAFTDLSSPKKSFLVCNEKGKRIHGKIAILPWEIFLHDLWSGRIL
jgi:uncharacterized protein